MLRDVTLPPPGWYPDPTSRFEHRFWDGQQWTGYVGARGHQWVDSMPPAPSVQVVRQTVPEVRSTGAAGAFTGGGTLFSEPILVFKQHVKARGKNLGYSIFDQFGEPLGTVQEVQRGMFQKGKERRKGQTSENRRYRLQVKDVAGNVMLELEQPATWLPRKSKMRVHAPSGEEIGTVLQETYGLAGAFATAAHTTLNALPMVSGLGTGAASASFVRKRLGRAAGWLAKHAGRHIGYTAARASGAGKLAADTSTGLDRQGHVRFGMISGKHRLGGIQSESIEDADFRIYNAAGLEIARLTKSWAGLLQEHFTSADNYVLQFHAPIGGSLGAMIVASAVAVDVAIKEGAPFTGPKGNRRYS